MSRIRGLVVGDTHCGSIYGLAKPGLKLSDDSELGLNPGQEHLWKCWQHMVGATKEIGFDFVVHMGDAIDGKQPRQKATELCLPLIKDQKALAVECLSLIKEARPEAAWYFIAGTEYHDGDACEALDDIAERCGAIQYYGAGTGRYSREVLDLNIENVVLNFAHHVGGATGFYRTTPIDREAQWSAFAGKDGKVPRADSIHRAHLHHFVHIEHESKHGFIGPCWQLPTRFMRHRSAYRMMPSIGSYIVEINTEAKKSGNDPIVFKSDDFKLLYPLPPFKMARLKYGTAKAQASI
jgi:hypothetical protein